MSSSPSTTLTKRATLSTTPLWPGLKAFPIWTSAHARSKLAGMTARHQTAGSHMWITSRIRVRPKAPWRDKRVCPTGGTVPHARKSNSRRWIGHLSTCSCCGNFVKLCSFWCTEVLLLLFQDNFVGVPYVVLSAEHTVLNQKHDAATAWVEDVTRSSFKICLREMQNFDGLHKDIKVVRTFFTTPSQPNRYLNSTPNFSRLWLGKKSIPV